MFDLLLTIILGVIQGFFSRQIGILIGTFLDSLGGAA